MPDLLLPNEAEWLGLTIRSESDQPHEWWAIGWCIRNRVLSDRYPNLFQAVVLSNKQFSYFNRFSHLLTKPAELYKQAKEGYAGDSTGWSENNLVHAEQCALEIIQSPRWHAPFEHKVCHYYSPISMVPKFSSPPWLKSASRIFTPSGIDPLRFVFAANVA